MSHDAIITIAGWGGLINDELVIVRESLQAMGWEVTTENRLFDEESTLEEIQSRRQRALDMGYTNPPKVLIKVEHWSWPG